MRRTNIGLLTCLALLSLAGNCPPDNQGGLSTTRNPTFSVSSVTLTGPGEIKNGSSATYTASVTITRSNNTGDITGSLDLAGSTEDKGPIRGFNGTFETKRVTIRAGGNQSDPVTFTLNCAPASPGVGDTLKGASTDSGHGGRVCVTAPPCPPGCERTRVGCPPGCGKPDCHDDPVTVAATFRDEFARNTNSPTLRVLCVP